MSPVYPNQFFGWTPAAKVFWVYPEDMDTVFEYNGRQRILLKPDAVYRAAAAADEAIFQMLTNLQQ